MNLDPAHWTELDPFEGCSAEALWRHVGVQPFLLHGGLRDFGGQEGPVSGHGPAARAKSAEKKGGSV